VVLRNPTFPRPLSIGTPYVQLSSGTFQLGRLGMYSCPTPPLRLRDCRASISCLTASQPDEGHAGLGCKQSSVGWVAVLRNPTFPRGWKGGMADGLPAPMGFPAGGAYPPMLGWVVSAHPTYACPPRRSGYADEGAGRVIQPVPNVSKHQPLPMSAKQAETFRSG
jgi:hypothetical protein